MKRLYKYIKKNEEITVPELYERVYKEKTGAYTWQAFYQYQVKRDDRIIVDNSSYPIKLKRKSNFFEKTLDKLNKVWYNNYRNKEKR